MFSLSFLDIMSCGFGAVILIYIIINHATVTEDQELNARLLAEVTKFEAEIKEETKNLIILRNSATEQENEITRAEQLSAEIKNAITQLKAKLTELREDGSSQNKNIEELKSELKELEEQAANLEGSVSAEDKEGTALRSVAGEGDRQYLTGMKVGGKHILILLDSSSSMLHKTIVNIIRRRNFSDEEKLNSKKWQRAIKTVEWITANMPKDANFQLFTFNSQARSAIPKTEATWLKTSEKTDTDAAIAEIRKIIPQGGTSLHNAFALAARMDPHPDNIFLIVDGLPTIGIEPPRKSTVSSKDRIELFTGALDLLPAQSPVNVILFPIEGDPIAAPSYWRLAQFSGGSFLAPSPDWP